MKKDEPMDPLQAMYRKLVNAVIGTAFSVMLSLAGLALIFWKNVSVDISNLKSRTAVTEQQILEERQDTKLFRYKLSEDLEALKKGQAEIQLSLKDKADRK